MSVPVIDMSGIFVGKKPAYPLTRRREWKTELVSYDSSKEQVNEIWSYPIRSWDIYYRLLPYDQRAKLVEIFDACRGRSRYVYFVDPNDYDGSSSWTQTKYNIIDLSQDDKYFVISGQHASEFKIGWEFKIAGSTGNNGVYTITDVYQTLIKTFLCVSEAIPSGTPNGYILSMYFLLYSQYYAGESYSISEPKCDIQPDSQEVKVDGITKTEGVHYTLDDAEGVVMFLSDYTPTDGQVITATFDFYYRVRFVDDSFEDSNIHGDLHNPVTIAIQEIKRF